MLLGAGLVAVFAATAALSLRLLPGPLRETDYLVAGSAGTLVVLVVLFVVIAATRAGAGALPKPRKK